MRDFEALAPDFIRDLSHLARQRRCGFADRKADHAAYIDNWLRILEGDRKAIFAAASAASRAAEFLGNMGKVEMRSAA